MALLGGTFNAEAKSKKRRSYIKKERSTKVADQTAKQEEPMNEVFLKVVEYNYRGMRMVPLSDIRLERRDGAVVMITKGTVTKAREFVLDDGEQLLKDILDIIEQEKMLDEKEANEGKSVSKEDDSDIPHRQDPPGRVLDGESWSLLAILSDKRWVSRSGGSLSKKTRDAGTDKIVKLLTKRAQELMNTD